MSSLATTSSNLEKGSSADTELQIPYPESIQLLDRRHWTPLNVAQMAAQFLATAEGVKVLDIGSGVGKFCLAGAYFKPMAFFFGVEQRKDLVAHAERARKVLGLQNAFFMNRNFMQVDFNKYDHFYFYNSFYENLSDTDKIDNNVTYSTKLYNHYNCHLYKKLELMPAGTRLVTFHSLGDKFPPSYHLVEARVGNLLKFWLKI